MDGWAGGRRGAYLQLEILIRSLVRRMFRILRRPLEAVRAPLETVYKLKRYNERYISRNHPSNHPDIHTTPSHDTAVTGRKNYRGGGAQRAPLAP